VWRSPDYMELHNNRTPDYEEAGHYAVKMINRTTHVGRSQNVRIKRCYFGL
jgi:hypothetical protein